MYNSVKWPIVTSIPLLSPVILPEDYLEKEYPSLARFLWLAQAPGYCDSQLLSDICAYT